MQQAAKNREVFIKNSVKYLSYRLRISISVM